LKRGDTVIEVGGHIGYISLYFKHLVGNGKVIVFEPGENNLPYLLKNIEGKGIEVVKKAVGKKEGVCSFFLDNLSGQNNSVIKDFFMRENTAANAFDPKAKGITETRVEMVTLDKFVATRQIEPTLVKIDIEGHELEALEGMREMIVQHLPILMVEVQVHHREIAALLEGYGYVLVQEDGQPFSFSRIGNVFCFHAEQHKGALAELKGR